MTLQSISSGNQALASAVQQIVDVLHGLRADDAYELDNLTANYLHLAMSRIPPIPTVTPVGGVGATTAIYWVASIDSAGTWTVGASRTINNATAGPYTGSIYNQITFPAVPGAAGYLFYRQIGAGVVQQLNFTPFPGYIAAPTPNTGTITINDNGSWSFTTFGANGTNPASVDRPVPYIQFSQEQIGGPQPPSILISPAVVAPGRVASNSAWDLVFAIYGSGGIAECLRITNAGHLIAAGPGTTTIAAAAGAAMGTALPVPSISIDAGSNDVRGTIRFGTGTAPTTGVLMTLTWGASFGTIEPVVIIQPALQGTAPLQFSAQNVISGGAYTGVQINVSVAPAANQVLGTYIFNYLVIG